MTEQELKDKGAKLICRVGVQSLPVYELNGDLYEDRADKESVVPQFTIVTDAGRKAWIRTWTTFRGS